MTEQPKWEDSEHGWHTHDYRITYRQDEYLSGDVYRLYERGGKYLGRFRTKEKAEKAIETISKKTS